MDNFYTHLIAASREPNPEGSPCCLLWHTAPRSYGTSQNLNLGTLTRHLNALEKLLPRHEPDLKRQIVADAVADLHLSLDVIRVAATTFKNCSVITR